jgi:capsular polysaccharide transport system permease protein
MTALAKATGIKAQLSVIHALLVRDALARFGHENLGFFWVIVEPLMFTTGIMVLWNIVRHTQDDLSITAFALTAYTMLTMFRHMSMGFVHILRNNSGVLYHAHIKPLDILIARGLLETIGCLATFFVAYIPLSLLGVIEPMRDPLLVFGAWFLAAWFSFSFGIIVEGLAEMNEIVERIMPPLMYLTLPLTGAFTMLSWLPPEARAVLAYSPLVNTMEMFRCGMFSADIVTYWSVPYVLAWCFVQTVIGLLLIENARKYIHAH